MKRPAVIKLNSGNFSFETLGYVTAERDNLVFEFEYESDKMMITACDGYAAVCRTGNLSYEFALSTSEQSALVAVTALGRLEIIVTGRKIKLKRDGEPGLFIKFCMNFGGAEEETTLTLRARLSEEPS